MEENIHLKISEDVIATIAVRTITSIEGVHEMSGGIMSGINNMLGKKMPTYGIKADVEDNKIYIDAYIVVEYGVKIPDIAWDIQDKVKKELEEVTGMTVETINVHIQGINFDKEEKE